MSKESHYTGRILYHINTMAYKHTIDKWIVVGHHPNYKEGKQFYIVAKITDKTDTSIAVINWRKIAYADGVDGYFKSREEVIEIYKEWHSERSTDIEKWLEFKSNKG